MQNAPTIEAAKAQIADAIAKVHEAMVLAGAQEIDHALDPNEPCEQTQTRGDAAVRDALLKSEDAMVSVLETLPTVPGTVSTLIN